MKRTDIVVIAVFLAAALCLYGIIKITAKSGNYAEVNVNGKTVKTLPLDKDTVYIPEGKNVRIEVKGGKIAFTESDCPDKICVKTGFIHTAGQTAVCLPNAVSVTVKSEEKNDSVDAVVQ
ncbi:MAG: NusG domain II-containing protein [Firmicutes bacterium]|nr:NusG domain II-containing protein [Bacillota bacterium]MBQ9604507.1 NusG domain II-containing protein [Bacillota bacterium]